MAQTPTGAQFAVASAYGIVKNITAISNAAEASVTATHDFAVGDFVEVTSGWGRLSKRVFRVKTVATTVSFVLEGMDTTNTAIFPAGQGIGTVRKASTFSPITTVMNPSISGGDPKKVTYKFIESESESTINDGFAPTDCTFELDADSIGSAGYTALKTLTDSQADTMLKIVMRSGSILLMPCTVALNEAVMLAEGAINKVKVSCSGNARLSRYAA